jgi:hypothetical protein
MRPSEVKPLQLCRVELSGGLRWSAHFSKIRGFGQNVSDVGKTSLNVDDVEHLSASSELSNAPFRVQGRRHPYLIRCSGQLGDYIAINHLSLAFWLFAGPFRGLLDSHEKSVIYMVFHWNVSRIVP